MFVASGGDHFAYEQCVAFTIQTILMPFIEKCAVFFRICIDKFCVSVQFRLSEKVGKVREFFGIEIGNSVRDLFPHAGSQTHLGYFLLSFFGASGSCPSGWLGSFIAEALGWSPVNDRAGVAVVGGRRGWVLLGLLSEYFFWKLHAKWCMLGHFWVWAAAVIRMLLWIVMML